MNVAGDAYKFFEQRMDAVGVDRALKAQALADTTVMVRRRGIDRRRAADLVEQFALRCDFAGVNVRAEIAKGLDAEIKQSPPNGRGSRGAQSEPDAAAQSDPDDELQDNLEPPHPILASYARKIAIADKNRKLNAWRRCCAEASKAIRKGLVDHSVVSDRLLELADAHDVFGLYSREKAEAEECWRALPHEAATQTPRKLILLDPTHWEGQPVPVRKWLVRDRIPAGKVCLLNGDGAAGKTTITLQLCAAAPRGTDWLGAVLEQAGPALFVSAEEDADEIHRRLAAIVDHHKITFAELKELGLHCIPGEDAVLGRADKSGIIQPTPFFDRLEQAASDQRAVLVAIEAAADVFAGNENDRSQVRQFIGLLTRIARASGAAVLLIQHPSLTGLSSGTGTSGSTAWNNSVRARMNFAGVKPANGDDAEPDLRQLQVLKSNYGPAGEVVRLRWQRGVFVPEGGPSPLARAAAEVPVDEAFLKCLDIRTAQGITVVSATGRGYAPSEFERMSEAGGLRSRAFASAMERLLSAGRIRVETSGPPSKRRTRLVRA
jgi:RecA-family ATPase